MKQVKLTPPKEKQDRRPNKLTDTAISKAKKTGETYTLPDGGLYLEVSPIGSKLWRLNDRFKGKQGTIWPTSLPNYDSPTLREKT